MTGRDLVDRYLEVAVDHHPGYRLAWDDFKNPSDGIDIGGLTDAYRSLTAGLGRPTADGQTADDHEAAVFRWCLQDRLFDLETAQNWRYDPQFWVDRQCYGILAQVTASDRLREKPIPHHWVRAFLGSLPSVMEAGQRALDRSSLGEIDVRRALDHLARSRDLAQRVGDAFGGGCTREIVRAKAAVEHFAAWLAAADGDRAPWRPLGEEVWSAGLRARTGLSTTADALEGILRRRIDQANRSIDRRHLTAGGRIPRTPEELSRLADHLAKPFGERFTTREVARIEALEVSVPGLSSATYQTSRSRGGGHAVVFVRPAAYTHRADLELDLIHEYRPGHHWQEVTHLLHHGSHPLCLRHRNVAFVEGWARWCEERYAHLVADPSVHSRLHARVRKSCGQALASLLLHARNRSCKEISGLLVDSGVCSPYQAPGLVLRAYFDPWQVVAPIAGHLVLRDLADSEGPDQVEREVTDFGAMDLFGKEIGGA